MEILKASPDYAQERKSIQAKDNKAPTRVSMKRSRTKVGKESPSKRQRSETELFGLPLTGYGFRKEIGSWHNARERELLILQHELIDEAWSRYNHTTCQVR